jgi:uncharacterized phage protein gp47/JayE
MAMPTIPSATEIQARIVADVESAIGQTVPLLPKAVIRVLAKAIALIDVLLYRSIMWVYAQIFPDTADYAALILLGALVGISPTKPVASVVTASVPGVTGESVPTGTNFRSNSGLVYQVTTGGTISGGVASCTLTCLSAGDAGNIANGELLTILSPDVNLTGTATITATVTDGADAETLDHFRARVVARYKRRMTGGSPADYEQWGLEAPHFVWISPVSGDKPGSVWVYGEVDNQTDGIPTSGQLTTLLSYLTTDPVTGIQSRRPIGDEVTCLPISRKVFDFAITIKDGTANIKADAESALADYLLSLSPYNSAINTERDDAVTDTGANAAVNDIARTGGATILQLVMREHTTGSQINSYMLYGGEKAKIGTVTWTDFV